MTDFSYPKQRNNLNLVSREKDRARSESIVPSLS